jgi:hypothetical protein
MLLEAETNKYCPGVNDFGAISNLITWVLNFFLSVLMISLINIGMVTVKTERQTASWLKSG